MKRILLTNLHPHQHGGGGHARYVRTILESKLCKDFEFGVAAPAFACPFPGRITEVPQMFGATRRFEQIYREWRPGRGHLNGSPRPEHGVLLRAARRAR